MIGDSQAYGRGHPEELIYVNWVEQELSRRFALGYSNWKVENWAVVGGLMPEFVVLGAAAALRKPDLVVVISRIDVADVDETRRSISWFISDAPLLLTDSSIRKLIPESFMKRHVRVSDWVKLYAEKMLPVLGLREYIWDSIYRDGVAVDYFMGTGWAGRKGFRWDSKRDEATEAQERIEQLKEHKAAGMGVEQAKFDVSLLQEYQELINILKKENVLTMIFAMPIWRDRYANMQDFDNFSDRLSELCRQSGVVYQDYSKVVPGERFEGATVLHFDGKTHKQFGQFLGRKLAEFMYGYTTTRPLSNVVQ